MSGERLQDHWSSGFHYFNEPLFLLQLVVRTARIHTVFKAASQSFSQFLKNSLNM